MGNGTTTSALFYGGDEGSNSKTLTEEFDGTNWTEVADLNTGRGYGAGIGANAEEALCVGGLAHPSGNLAICESWNGTAWTEVADLATARRAGGGGGVATSAILSGGSPNGSPPYSNSNATEEFTAAEFQIKSVTTS